MSRFQYSLLFFVVLCLIVFFLALALMTTRAHAYSQGHESEPKNVQQWYARQVQPDNPPTSCCGDYDAYWADEFEQKDGKFYAIITDDRVGKEIEAGTRVLIPEAKMPNENARQDPNPTGHGIVFMSTNRDIKGVAYPGKVYCYFFPVLN